MESMFSVIFAIIIAVIFSWPMALIALLLLPFMMIGSAISAKRERVKYNVQGGGSNEKDKSEADLLAADAIQNYKTV